MSISKWCAPLLVAIVLAGCGTGEALQSPAPTQNEPPVQATVLPPEVAATAKSAPVASDISSPAPTVDINCTETNPHPVGQSIAETYQTSYEEVMTFFCTGVPFEDITLAYQTAEITGVDVKEVMTLWYDYDKNWDDVWTELGIQ